MHWSGAGWLMRATREREENGVLLREWLAVQPGQAVADFGCGNGYHTLPLAKAVGAAGTVYAVDLQPQMLTLLEQRCEQQQIGNVNFVTATLDDPNLPANSCDLILLVDVYHELSHPVRVMAKLQKALKPAGRVVLVEFRKEDDQVPIKPEHMMTKAQIVREMASHGFRQVEQFDELPWQHAMAFGKAVDPDARSAPRQVVAAFLVAASSNQGREAAAFLPPALSKDLPRLPVNVRSELRAGGNGDLRVALTATHDVPLPAAWRELLLHRDEQGRWLVQPRPSSSASASANPNPASGTIRSSRPFVVMHTALGSGNRDEQLQSAQRYGFDGLAWSMEQVADARLACERTDHDLWSCYAVLDVATEAAQREAAVSKIRAAMTALTGGPGMLWLSLQNSSLASRSQAGDAAARSVLQELLQHAETTGVEIALYPHYGAWLEATEDALRLCEQLPHPKLGICFNLCHFLRNHDSSDPTALLERCGARLFAVTINGANSAGQNWEELIQPLDQGDFDLRGLLATLDRLQFVGPIALQGYGLKTPATQHLPASQAAYRRLLNE